LVLPADNHSIIQATKFYGYFIKDVTYNAFNGLIINGFFIKKHHNFIEYSNYLPKLGDRRIALLIRFPSRFIRPMPLF